ncbi:tungsten formylmethanofuran dehydrogenase [Candidatus Marinimicrobia bacterium MT.SAG.2]|nr:tungsten formylmethanofuran dehydrogenase [Candidatus Marinimicrobia bacterium MT.SAG.2]
MAIEPQIENYTNHSKLTSPDELLKAYKFMLISRRLDEKMLSMLKQGKGFFHIGAAGHEAAQLAAAFNLKSKEDWAFPYYRDLAFVLGFGMTPEEIMMCFTSKADDPNSGGRQMPAHYGHRELNIVSQSSPTGTQFLQAVGVAMGLKKRGSEQVVYVSSGEGTTSQGDFHEALNWASRDKLPLIFFIENNKYAISVPISEQTAGGSVYNMTRGYEGLSRYQIDGTDFTSINNLMKEVIGRVRLGEGPALVEADCVRLLPHSSSDDQKKYRSEEELAADIERDPIGKLKDMLLQSKVLTEEEDSRMVDSAKNVISSAVEFAVSKEEAPSESALKYLFDESGEEDSFEYEKTEPAGELIVIVDAINHALHEEMERDPDIIMFGQDIADGKGGVFTATRGLSTKFGSERVFNSPLAESSIVGTAIGLALNGYKPVVEIQFADYIWTAMMQIRNELSSMRYRSNNAWSCPVVLRVPCGGYIHGSLYHSQNIESYFAHIPGLKICMPSNAADAKGLLKTAIRGNDPVLFLEHKGIYRQPFAKSPEPDKDYLVPFGKAKIVREGKDITIVTYGALVKRSIDAASKLEGETGISVEVIDIRSMVPLDIAAIEKSIAKTSRILIVHEDTIFQGFGAEIAAQISDVGFGLLDAPIRRVAGKHIHIPYAPNLENYVLPNDEDIYSALNLLSAY